MAHRNQPIKYFDHLNYSLANEDSRVELAALPPDQRHVLVVAGSGARVLPLLARAPARITCVDLSPQQLMLTELRVQSARTLSLDDYLAFWGYPPVDAAPSERKSIFEALELQSDTRDYFRRGFEQRDWTSILYTGRWERTFVKMNKLNAALTRRAGRDMFQAKTIEEQRHYLKTRFPRLGWLTTLAITGNPIAFNLMLYRGDFPKKNIPGSPFAFYRSRFDHLFTSGLARENFFLQLVFLGHLQFPEGNPIECQPEVYAEIQKNLRDGLEVRYQLGDVLSILDDNPDTFDFVSLSDVPSYLAPPVEQRYLRIARRAVRPGGRLVTRYYLRIPERSDRTGWIDATDRFRDVIEQERVGVYEIEVFDAQ